MVTAIFLARSEETAYLPAVPQTSSHTQLACIVWGISSPSGSGALSLEPRLSSPRARQYHRHFYNFILVNLLSTHLEGWGLFQILTRHTLIKRTGIFIWSFIPLSDHTTDWAFIVLYPLSDHTADWDSYVLYPHVNSLKGPGYYKRLGD